MVHVTVDQNDLHGHSSATVSGGLKSGSLGLGLAIAGAAAGQRFSPAFRKVTLPLKAFGVTSVTTASFIIGADSASRKYELSKYASGSGTALEREAHAGLEAERNAGILQGNRADQRLTTQLGTKDLMVEWAKNNRYSVVFAAWLASMAGSFGYISMTPLSFAQKLVQARMVAQGLTVAVLIASAGLSAIPNAQGVNEDELKRESREDSMYKWGKDSPHSKAHPHGNGSSTSVSS